MSVILVHDDRVPKKGDEDSSFFNRWNQKIRQQVPTGLDYLFASEKYGSRLAKMLGAHYVPVDPARTTVPISAAQIRANPLAHWDYLPPCVRPFYLRRVCLLGPEAPGKTALAAQLASHFGTCYVGDYAHILREVQNELTPADVQRLARAEWAAEKTLARQANRVLFLDADLMALRFWSEHHFGWCPDWICQAAQSRPYDLYLVPDLDAPLVGEPWHGQTEAQRAFLATRCGDAGKTWGGLCAPERLMGGTLRPCRGRGRSPVAQEALAGFRPAPHRAFPFGSH